MIEVIKRENSMATIYEMVETFKRKYPLTVGWRWRRNASVVEAHLNPDEELLYAFIAQKATSMVDIFSSAVVALTNKRVLIGGKRVVLGYFLDSVTPDLFNDVKVTCGLVWGKVHFDTENEFITLSNVSRSALIEIETKIAAYMADQKRQIMTEQLCANCRKKLGLEEEKMEEVPQVVV